MSNVHQINLDTFGQFFKALAEGRLAAVGDELLTPAVSWRIAGRHPLAGTHVGLAAVQAFFGQLGRAGFRTEVLFRQADEQRVVQLHRGWTDEVDLLWVLICRFEDGRIAEAWSIPSDQHAADDFFHSHFELAGLPVRLAATSIST